MHGDAFRCHARRSKAIQRRPRVCPPAPQQIDGGKSLTDGLHPPHSIPVVRAPVLDPVRFHVSRVTIHPQTAPASRSISELPPHNKARATMSAAN